MLLNKYDVEKNGYIDFYLYFFLWPIFTNLNGGKTSQKQISKKCQI